MNLEMLRLLVEENAHLSGETEIRMAQQPHYPLQTTINNYQIVGCDDARIAELEEAIGDTDSLDEAELVEARDELANLQRDGNQSSIIYLTEGSQVYDEPYLPGHVVKLLGWGR